MLPFLKKAKESSGANLIIKTREPDQAPDESQDSSAIESAAQDLMSAIQVGDVKAVASALQAAYEMCASEPDGDEASPHSYDAQNIKAGEQE